MAQPGLEALSELSAKIIRFGGVGLLCSFLYAVLMMGLRQFTGLSLPTSHVLAFAAVIPVSYYLQRSFTFRYAGSDRRSVPRFLVASGLAWLVSIIAVTVAKDVYDLDEFAAIAMVLVIVPTMNFATMLLWVFIDPKPAVPPHLADEGARRQNSPRGRRATAPLVGRASPNPREPGPR